VLKLATHRECNTWNQEAKHGTQNVTPLLQTAFSQVAPEREPSTPPHLTIAHKNVYRSSEPAVGFFAAV